MSAPVPTFAGWYPDADTGGTKYGDGKQWTGDTRPPRKPLAAAARPDDWNLFFLGISAPALPIVASLFPDESVEQPLLQFLVGAVMLLDSVAYGIYLFRGQGPSTRAVEARLAGDRKEVKAKRRSANLAGVAAALVHHGRPQQSAKATSDAAFAAQVNAIASTATASSLRQRPYRARFARASFRRTMPVPMLMAAARWSVERRRSGI